MTPLLYLCHVLCSNAVTVLFHNVHYFIIFNIDFAVGMTLPLSHLITLALTTTHKLIYSYQNAQFFPESRRVQREPTILQLSVDASY
jgi:hypothetical protein